MASEFLRKKWEIHFKANDLNNDGVIDVKDSNIFSDRFIMHYKIEGERAKQLKKDFRAIWNDLFLFEREEIDLTTYVELMAKEYTENTSRFVERHSRAERNATKIFDVNNDGRVSEDEFMTVLECWGIKTLDRKYVQAYPQINPGFISCEVFADSWIAFNTNGDESKIEIEKTVMFGLRMIDSM